MKRLGLRTRQSNLEYKMKLKYSWKYKTWILRNRAGAVNGSLRGKFVCGKSNKTNLKQAKSIRILEQTDNY